MANTTRMMVIIVAFIYLTFIGCCTAQTICSSENRESEDGLTACLQAIRDRMVDESAFWFGTDYPARCPIPEYTIECQNFNPTPTSMADRLWHPGTFNGSTIENFMDIIIHEKPGTYEGCGHAYKSDIEADHSLDPVDPVPLTPWQAAHDFSPSVIGLTDTNAQYTLVIQDAGYFPVHGVYTNIPGDTLDIAKGEEIDAYSGPLYYKTDPQNPYIFLLFRQSETNMGLTQFWKDYFNSFAFNNFFNISDFVADQNLYGPIAVNWLMSLTDPYAAGKQQSLNFVNICPMFVEEGYEQTLPHYFKVMWQETFWQTTASESERVKDLYHVPNDVPFTVSINVDYFSKGMDFSTCCNEFSYKDATYSLDPIGDGMVSPFDNRDPPASISLVKMKLDPLPIDFIGELHTLLMFDPDITHNDAIATEEKPLAHWLIINIPDGRVDEGEVVMSYRGSMPPAGITHSYQFLLYEQQSLLDIDPNDYNPDCQIGEPSLSNRCLWEVERFVSENQLQFLGATWYVATSDAYIAHLKVERGEPKEEVCALIPGYEDPCPSSGISLLSSMVFLNIIIGAMLVRVIET